MMEVHQGKIMLEGTETTQSSSRHSPSSNEIRSRLNVVPQDPFIIPGTSIRFNIDPFENATSDDDIIPALQRVGLWNHIKDNGGLDGGIDGLALSTGQKQLLCFVRAMLRRKTSNILILDEVMSR
jgi:ABC-type multidrug transport system fused ATPase/permease subunit